MVHDHWTMDIEKYWDSAGYRAYFTERGRTLLTAMAKQRATAN